MEKEVRNSRHKLVCVIDETKKKIEITQKGVTTIITVTPSGKFNITEKNTGK